MIKHITKTFSDVIALTDSRFTFNYQNVKFKKNKIDKTEFMKQDFNKIYSIEFSQIITDYNENSQSYNFKVDNMDTILIVLFNYKNISRFIHLQLISLFKNVYICTILPFNEIENFNTMFEYCVPADFIYGHITNNVVIFCKIERILSVNNMVAISNYVESFINYCSFVAAIEQKN